MNTFRLPRRLAFRWLLPLSVAVVVAACVSDRTVQETSAGVVGEGEGGSSQIDGGSGAPAAGGRGVGGANAQGGTGGMSTAGGGTSPMGSGGASSDSGPPGAGGLAASGGAIGTGGTVETGGAVATGGSASTGGAVSTGGSVSTGGAVATGGRASTGGAPATGGTPVDQPTIPPLPASCPTLATGTVTVLGKSVQLWVGTKQPGVMAPVMFYWHGTGGMASEATSQLGSVISEIQSQGGVVASFTTTLATGVNTSGNQVWYSDDFQMADIILACAVQQLNIDTRRIYTAGCSAGGLQAGAMAYFRSGYLAAAMPNSGGVIATSYQFQNPSHIPSVITAHGGASDVVIISFTTTSQNLCNGISNASGYAVDCNHGGGHCQAPSALRTAQWQFLKDHPFEVNPDPYPGGLPASFPTYCTPY